MERFSIEWQAPEFDYREKDVSWYWISAMVAIVLLVAAVWQKNFLFAVFIVMAEVLVLVWAGQKPKIVRFKIDDKGLTIDGKKFYPYSVMGAFAVSEDTDVEWRELAFRFNHGLRPLLKIRMPSDKSAAIEKSLSSVITKVDFEESLVDVLEKLIGF